MVIYVYRKNLFGDITEIYQGATCVAKYKYDAWGNCTVCNPDGTVNVSADFIGNINPFRYRGYYWDNDLQLYYLQTRYYDPSVCRFISPDSHEYLDPATFGGLNLYAYCLNNPIMYVDPSGHAAITISVIIETIIDIGFIIWGVVDLVKSIKNKDGKFWKNLGALFLDILFAVTPFVSSGTGRVIKAGNKIDNAVDVASAINKIDNIQDMPKVTMIGRNMDRVRDTASLIGITDNIFNAKTITNTIRHYCAPVGDILTWLENGAWMLAKLGSGYTIIDIGIKASQITWGAYYGLEKFLILLWKTRNLWKIPLNIL